MRRRRSNPWPAFSDLFAALLLITFAGWMAMSATASRELTEQTQEEEDCRKEREKASEAVHALATTLQNALVVHRERSEVNEDKTSEDEIPRAQIRVCGPDRCVDFTFDVNSDELSTDQTKTLEAICPNLRQALNKSSELPLQLIVEGHTDDQPATAETQAEGFRYNWNLSSRRVSGVLFTLDQCGLSADQHHILSSAYADSQPLCKTIDDKCRERNRRVTFRIGVHGDPCSSSSQR